MTKWLRAIPTTIAFLASCITLAPLPTEGSPWVPIQGNVHLADGTPICAMVLANGQHTFSCDGVGSYNLTVPLDENGEITLFSFADGFAPFRVTDNPDSLPSTVPMQTAAPDSPSINVSSHLAHSDMPNWWVRISGDLWSDGGVPLCALVLANGQHMFSCNESLGHYDLTVPPDENNKVTLFAFADGFQPYSNEGANWPNNCRDWDEIRLGEFLLSNNVWGKDEIDDYSQPYKQCIYGSGDADSLTVKWIWTWPERADDKIMAYPEIIYGWKPWNRETTTPDLPRKIEGISDLSISYNLSLSAQGKHNLAFDIWITNSEDPSPDSITREIMIWVDSSNLRAAGQLIETVTVDGSEHKFYKARFENWDYLAFVRTSPAYQGTYNVLSFIQYLLRNNHITSEEFVSSIEFGNEILMGNGELELQDYFISVR